MAEQPPPPSVPPVGYGAPGAVARPPLRMGLAIASLVCGILGFCLPVVPGLLAILFGLIALINAQRKPATHGGTGMAIGGMCVGGMSLVISLLLLSILIPSFARAREMAKRSVCTANLTGIGMALHAYADENNDQLPTTAQLLTKEGFSSPKSFVCPSAETGDYIYIPGLKPTDDVRTPVMFEPLSNHNGEGAFILFLDSHAEWVEPDEWTRILAPYEDRIGPLDQYK